MTARRGAVILILLLVTLARRAPAAGPPEVAWPRLAAGPLQDNSFLIEEAYNQERGVIQHIVDALWQRDSKDWTVLLTDEWPVPDVTNQLSFTLPLIFPGTTQGHGGPGDVLLNYRYQLFEEGPRRPAVAPRISLVLPTGSVRDGTGDGTVGVQALLPVSKQLGPHFAAHLNLGGDCRPHALDVDAPGRSERLTTWLAGGSLIWEPVDAIGILAELVGLRTDEFTAHGKHPENKLVFDPGVRVGWDGPWGVQWVGGIGIPIGLTDATEDLGVFLYFSAEHAVTAAARKERP
jgi:hypothetical protein